MAGGISWPEKIWLGGGFVTLYTPKTRVW